MYGYNQEHWNSILKAYARLCRSLQANIIAGPINSGAVIASSVATYCNTIAGYSIETHFIPKQKCYYTTRRHPSGVRIATSFPSRPVEERILLVDDVIETGETILDSISYIPVTYRKQKLMAVVADIVDRDVALRLYGQFPGIAVFRLACKGIEPFQYQFQEVLPDLAIGDGFDLAELRENNAN